MRSGAPGDQTALGLWRRYRRSPMGVFGLVVLLLFVSTALAAPWIAPFAPEATAPSIDILEAHSTSLPLPPGTWGPPRPIVRADGVLEAVLVLGNGKVLLFPVEAGRLELELGTPAQYDVPAGTFGIESVPVNPRFLLSWNATSLVRWTPEMAPLEAPHDLEFDARATSGTRTFGKLWGVAVTGEDGIGFLAGRDALGSSFGETKPPVWFSSVRVADARIVGAPELIILETDGGSSPAARGNLLVVPTDRDVRAYEVVVTKAGSRVTDVTLGAIAWQTNLTGLVDGRPLAFPTTTGDEFGKDRILAASGDGTLAALSRANGSILWAAKPYLRTAPDAVPVFLQGTARGVVLAAFESSGGAGVVAAIDPRSGIVASNHTSYVNAPSPPVTQLEYVEALKQYLFSTRHGTAYLVGDDLRVQATFSIPGGAVSPVTYVGNIFSNIGAPQKGNYFAASTADGRVFAQSTGNLRTPLPPGCALFGLTVGEAYPSGNCYLLGTDAYGHDILSWLVWGTRAELYVGVTAAFVAVVIGTVVGLVAGYVGGFLDDLLMRITDINLTLPVLVIALLVVAMFGPSLLHVILIIAFLSWAVTARVIRSQTLSLKERPFVNAARMSGASGARIVFRHLAPNVLPFTFLFMTFGVSGAIIVEALLSFLGFGDPNAVTWGMMLQFLYISGHTLSAPWWLVPPGIAITLLSLSFYLVGRAFDDIVNPRLRTR